MSKFQKSPRSISIEATSDASKLLSLEGSDCPESVEAGRGDIERAPAGVDPPTCNAAGVSGLCFG